MHSLLAWLYWDPERVIFTLPIIQRPIVWYGLFFVLGFLIGYFLLIAMFSKVLAKTPGVQERNIKNWKALIKQIQGSKDESLLLIKERLEKRLSETSSPKTLKEGLLKDLNTLSPKDLQRLFPKNFLTPKDLATHLIDKLTWYVVLATIIGARLGHVFFYDWPYYQAHPGEIIKVWEGGLASHGGTLAVLISVFLYHRNLRKKFPEFTLISLMDMLCIPSAFVAFCIRIGNFTNQEITGYPTDVPWAVIFGHPAEGGGAVPRHPVQLYEAFVYLITFFLLYGLYRKKNLAPGKISAIFFLIAFGLRIPLESFKTLHGSVFNETYLTTGQLLSLPFILLGCLLFFSDKIFSKPSKGPQQI